MSTVAEIEAAIQQLPIEQMREVAEWLDEYQATINASAAIFTMLDAEEDEGRSVPGFALTKRLQARILG